MPCLSADEPLPRRPMRVLVAGTSGSGKSTLARLIGAALGLPYFEIDSLYHGPDWVPRPRFLAEVVALADGPAWVTEWQYPAARELLADRAELLVWLDLPRRVVMSRVVRRTVVRSRSGVELWNGNREPPLHTILTDRDHIIRWAWRTRGESSPRVRACLATRPGLTGVRLRSQAEVERWVGGSLSARGRPAARRAPGRDLGSGSG